MFALCKMNNIIRTTMPAILTKELPPITHNRDYITKLRKWKIAHRSVSLAYDTSTNTKKCIPPPG